MLTFSSLVLVFGLPDFEAFFTVPISAFFSNGLVDVHSTYTFTSEYIFLLLLDDSDTSNFIVFFTILIR